MAIIPNSPSHVKDETLPGARQRLIMKKIQFSDSAQDQRMAFGNIIWNKPSCGVDYCQNMRFKTET
jgi:hypothetical protein